MADDFLVGEGNNHGFGQAGYEPCAISEAVVGGGVMAVAELVDVAADDGLGTFGQAGQERADLVSLGVLKFVEIQNAVGDGGSEDEIDDLKLVEALQNLADVVFHGLFRVVFGFFAIVAWAAFANVLE